MPIELKLLGWSIALLVIHIMVQGQTATNDRGLDFNAGARDVAPRPLGILAGRAQRALRNFQETWPAFIALALGLAITGRVGGLGAVGAIVWFGARTAYLPLYLLGVPYVRSVAWLVSMLGLLLMLIRFL